MLEMSAAEAAAHRSGRALIEERLTAVVRKETCIDVMIGIGVCGSAAYPLGNSLWDSSRSSKTTYIQKNIHTHIKVVVEVITKHHRPSQNIAKAYQTSLHIIVIRGIGEGTSAATR